MKKLVLALALLAAPTFAQQPNERVCKDDETLMVVRLSKLTPEGSQAGYQGAVAAHQAWYRDKGYSDVIVSKPVLKPDGTRSDSEFLSLRMADARTENRVRQPDDKAWDAFVAMYRANSEITTETASCMPKGLAAAK